MFSDIIRSGPISENRMEKNIFKSDVHGTWQTYISSVEFYETFITKIIHVDLHATLKLTLLQHRDSIMLNL